MQTLTVFPKYTRDMSMWLRLDDARVVLPRTEMRIPYRDAGEHMRCEVRLRVDAAKHGVLTRTSAWDGRPWSWPYLVRNMECVQWTALAVAILGHTNHLILDVVLV